LNQNNFLISVKEQELFHNKTQVTIF